VEVRGRVRPREAHAVGDEVGNGHSEEERRRGGQVELVGERADQRRHEAEHPTAHHVRLAVLVRVRIRIGVRVKG
jgi:hypothetical protein|tara:strand:+ start:97 stop:321 length:225 start_codon:yes stop_codon:yes gene_type:complete